ncbi:CRAL/TRIO domain-containing protein [Hesseltinella vesiculosa]|uniref:CRAL/TRIO domain-containing protein n=1 Tax=Hesseltinella vesiculosa TaxID=101127 RepID=A0A1X2G9P9_9FUNG|nr:CRAL/TRIO domain-containing protein [Hesseltinella vesiculosa]
MGTLITEQLQEELNRQYNENAFVLEDLEQKLILALDDFGFTGIDKEFAIDFVQDHVTLFRFLKDAEFDRDFAYQRILDAVLWRREKHLEALDWNAVDPAFYQTDHAFAYFRRQDRFGRPMAMIRMRYFPTFGGESMADTIPPFACLVMEIARKWTRDLTRQQGKLISQMSVVVDIAKAPMMAPETRLIQEMRTLTDDHFPGFFGSIYVMNFGWMYQGLWQMVKLMLTERAKTKVNFPTLQEVTSFIDLENVPHYIGGKDSFEWTLEDDSILQQYGRSWLSEHPSIKEDQMVTRSRSASFLSMASSPDEFFDAPDSLATARRTSVYGTPVSRTPSALPLVPIFSPSNAQQVPYFQLTGLHMPTFLASFFGATITSPHLDDMDALGIQRNKEQQEALNQLELSYRLTNLALEQQIASELSPPLSPSSLRREPHFPHLLPADDPNSLYANAPLKIQLRRSEQRLIRWSRRIFRLSFAHHGAFYWVMLYLFLRGPVEQSLRRLLAKMMVNQRTITYTTVGLTASVAAGLSASLSNSLGS